jgi:hypothetical protein
MGRKTKKDYMQDETFAELIESAGQALAYERGARDGYRVVQVESTKSPREASAGETVSPKSNPSSQRKHKNAAEK